MAREWENPNYRRKRSPWLLLIFLVVALLALFLIRQNRRQPEPPKPVAVPQPKVVSETTIPVAHEAPLPGTEPDAEAVAESTIAPELPQPGAEPVDGRLLRQANESYRDGRYQEAADLFLQLSRSQRSYLAQAGVAYFRLNRLEEALYTLEQAAADNPQNFLARKYLALAYDRQDNLDKSLENARIGLTLSPDPELKTLYERLLREKPVQENYADLRSAHFKILFDGREHRELKRPVLEILRDAYDSIGKRLGHYPTDSVTVILYTERDFFNTTLAPGWAGGLFDGKIRVPVRGVQGREAALRRVLFHEYTHALIYGLTPLCPLWVDEGLAMLFTGEPLAAIGQLIPLSQLEKGFPSGDTNLITLAYLESHAAVAYLADKYGLYRFTHLLEHLGQGETMEQAFSISFSIPYSRFLTEWGQVRR